MKNFVEVTHNDTDLKGFINLDFIQGISKNGKVTKLVFANGDLLEVKETPQEILNQITK